MEKQWRKMTKGQQIEYAIFKAVSEYSFVEWLETWGIREKDWKKFMDAGKAALHKPHQVTNKDLTDFCNDMGGLCERKNCEYYEECNAYENTYGDIPFAEDTLHPDRYTDEVIVIEESDEDGD